MGLVEIQAKWFLKFEDMRRAERGDALAAPFFSYHSKAEPTSPLGPILLVGKATAKSWKLQEFQASEKCPISDRVKERLAATKGHLKEMGDRQPSAFWRFWKALHAFGSPVIWTNQAKIGMRIGNPKGGYFSAQADLAHETLRAEADEYNPSLVVIVGELGTNEIIHRTFGKRADWNEQTDELCWIEAKGQKPAVLWVDHPERKKRRRVELWLEKAGDLIGRRR